MTYGTYDENLIGNLGKKANKYDDNSYETCCRIDKDNHVVFIYWP